MKTFIHLSVFVALFAMISCKPAPDHQFVGNWKTDAVEILNLDELVGNMLAEANIPDSLPAVKDSVKASIEAKFVESIEGMKQIEFSLNEDKSFVYKGTHGESKGTWSVSEDLKTLETTIEGSTDKMVQSIEEITDTKMVGTIEVNGTKTKYTMSKVVQ